MPILQLCMLLAVLIAGTRADTSSNDEIVKEGEFFFEELPRITIAAPSIKSKAYSLNFNSYVLDWDPGRNKSDINFFFLRYRSRTGLVWHYKKLPANYTSYSFENLSPETKYSVQLIGIKSRTAFSRTSISSFQTGKGDAAHKDKDAESDKDEEGDVPPAPDATSTKISFTSVYINWYVKTNGQSPVLRYKLLKSFSETNLTKWSLVNASISPMTTSYKVHGLQPGVSYKFQLIAINKFGESLPGEIKTNLPKAPVVNMYLVPPDITAMNLINNGTTIHIQWEYDSETFTEISKFQIICYEKGSDKKPRVVNIPDLQLREYYLSKMRPKKVYEIKMKTLHEDHVSQDSNLYVCNRTCKSLHYPIYPTFSDEYEETNLNLTLDKSVPDNYDMAYFISGVTFGFVVLVLAVSGIVYRHKLADQRKKLDCAEDGNSKNFHQQVCDKVVSHLRKTQQLPQMDFLGNSNCCNNTTAANPQTNEYTTTGSDEEDKAQPSDPMLDACHCAATGVAQLDWANNHVF